MQEFMKYHKHRPHQELFLRKKAGGSSPGEERRAHPQLQFSHLYLSHLSNNKLLIQKTCSLTKNFFLHPAEAAWGELCASLGEPRLGPAMAAGEGPSGQLANSSSVRTGTPLMAGTEGERPGAHPWGSREGCGCAVGEHGGTPGTCWHHGGSWGCLGRPLRFTRVPAQARPSLAHSPCHGALIRGTTIF